MSTFWRPGNKPKTWTSGYIVRIFYYEWGGFYNGDGKFWKIIYIHSWYTAANPLIFWRPPPSMLPTTPFSNFGRPPPPPPFSVVLLLWLNGWSCHFSFANLHNDKMDPYISKLGALVSEGPWSVFFARRHQVYWSLTQCGFLLVIWFDITYAKHRQYIQGPADWHTHINLYLHHLLDTHSSYLYYVRWCVNEQNTHTHTHTKHLKRMIILKRVS